MIGYLSYMIKREQKMDLIRGLSVDPEEAQKKITTTMTATTTE